LDCPAAGEVRLIPYRLAPRARDDLARIARYYKIKKRNPAAADRVVLAIRDTCSRAGADPGIGRPRSDIEPGLYLKLSRRYPYMILYRLAQPETGFRVDIARILHQRRDLGALLSDLG
jgi:plasmid stabilization system protein ParE